jgi:hypothetical protein
MSTFTRSEMHRAPTREPGRRRAMGPVLWLINLYGDWEVRRQMLAAQMFDGASLRDIGVAPGGLENAIRHGRRPCG